ncbi:hypothetical protein C1J01_46815, partial [Nonomuraea aridisoli]
MAATLPYLVLKLLWLAGSSVGVTDPDLTGDATMMGLNAMTFGMEVVPWRQSHRAVVYLLVYGGFMTQGVSLMIAFALYARERWPDVFTTATASPFTSPPRSLQTVVARGCLLVAVPVGGVRLA